MHLYNLILKNGYNQQPAGKIPKHIAIVSPQPVLDRDGYGASHLLPGNPWSLMVILPLSQLCPHWDVPLSCSDTVV